VTFRPFSEARKYAHTLKLKNRAEWREYSKSEKKPDDVPSYPEAAYKQYWKGWNDWLGASYVAYVNRKYRSFREAREFARSLGIKNRKEWWNWCKSGKKPKGIPSNPDRAYKNEWISWPDWLDSQVKLLPFKEAREFVHSLRLKSYDEWPEYCKSGKPKGIPSNPKIIYKDEWQGARDWLGIEFLPYEEANKYVRSLGFKNRREYETWTKSGKNLMKYHHVLSMYIRINGLIGETSLVLVKLLIKT
jgi:hypothetical protein